MFRFDKEQKVFNIGNIKVGGQPGENPPLLIASLFQKGDRLLIDRKGPQFDKDKAKEYILRQEELTSQTGIPGLIAMVANSVDEMKAYIDFFIEITDMPFAIDIWVSKIRLASARYAASLGLQDRLLYNGITPWDKDIPEQIAELKELGIKHVVLQAFDDKDQTPRGRITSLRRLLDLVGDANFKTILVDTSVMNLPAITFSLIANYLIKEEFGLPAGCATSNGTYMWKQAREVWGKDGFAAMDAAAHGISALLWSDFLFYGPLVSAKRIFPAVATAHIMLSTLVYDETGWVSEDSSLPINRFYADFVEKMKEGGARD
ncbi:MAG: tetrahydromethanopterin S-methyltransferase subunit H [Nitrospirota bacterium]